ATADDKSKIYGESNPTFTITYTGFVNGDDATSITTEPTASTTADETTGVGTYDIDLTGGAADNYSFNLTSGTLTVYKATLTVTADDKLKGFSQVNPELTMTYTGFVNGDDVSDIDVEPGISTTADETTPAGTVSITLTGGSDDNYSLNLVDGTMTIVDASIITSVTVPADGTYKIGDKLEFTATFSLPITIAGVPIIPLTIGAEVKAAMLTGSVSNGSTATFSYTVVEGDLDIDGIALGTNIDLNGGTIVDGFGTDASLTLTNAGSAALVNVDGVRPSAPVVTSVSDDSGFDGADGVTFDQTLMISGTAEANILVEVFIDGTSIGTTASDANGDWIFDNTANTLEGGYYTITAKTTDSAGNISDASADYAVEIDVVAPAPPPAPTIDPVSDLGVSNSDNLTNDKTPTIIGTAEANAIIEITSDKDGLLGTTTADANGDWTFTPTSDLSEGSHEITVKATDAAGNQGGASDPLSKELDFTLELVSFSPADNAIDVLPGTDLTIDFGENVNKGTGNIIIKQSNDNTVLETIDVTSDKVSISGSVVTINPENAILPQATEFYVLLDAGTFTDDSGNAHAGISNNTDWTFTTIDATVVTSVGIPNDGTYGIGDDLAIELTFSQAVTFTGSPTIDLTIGTQTVAATLQGTVSASTTATFAYTVEEGDLDVDGINVGTTINLNGGTLKDAFDVDAITALVGIGSTVNVKVDGVRATPTLSTSAGDLTNAAFTVTVTYDEEVSGLSATDLEVSNGTVNSVNVVTAGLVWEAEIAPTADGTTTVSVLAGAVADNAGNTSVASTNLISTTFDGTAPEVSSIAKAEPDQIPTGTATRSFTVVFSEEVTGVDVTDFEVITTGTATASINAVTATDAKTYTVSVNGISGEGTIGLNAKDDGSIIDAATNSLADAFTGEVYTTNFAPTDITLSASSIQENNDVDEEVATLSTTDADAGDSFTYSLVSGTGDADNASFTINGDKLLAAEAFDFETKDSYSIRLKTDDGFGGSFEKELTINITNEGEAIIGIAGEGEFEQTTLGLSTTKTWTVTNSGDVATEVRIISSSQGFSFSPGSVQVEAGASQEITAVFSPSEAKVYSGVVVFNYDITDDMQDNVIEVNLSGEGVIVTGIDNGQISDEQIAVFPNPASSYVTIDLSELNGMPLDIRMVNSTGVSKLEKEGYDKPELRIDVTNFENGLYIIQFSNERSLVRKKVLIRK
ncbi:MAG: Ig-like domain-containing protein, partial [Cytophagia bacterium]|nr:Ig-like domain-containing protein [Cytophagia bacterium]